MNIQTMIKKESTVSEYQLSEKEMEERMKIKPSKKILEEGLKYRKNEIYNRKLNCNIE